MDARGAFNTPLRVLLRDRDSTFRRHFDTVFRREGIEIIRTPVRAPKVNAISERPCPYRPLRVSRLAADRAPTPLERVLRVFVDHSNSHRPHRSLNLKSPHPSTPKPSLVLPPASDIERRDRPGGLIHEYTLAA